MLYKRAAVARTTKVTLLSVAVRNLTEELLQCLWTGLKPALIQASFFLLFKDCPPKTQCQQWNSVKISLWSALLCCSWVVTGGWSVSQYSEKKHVTSYCQQEAATLGFTSYDHASFQYRKTEKKKTGCDDVKCYCPNNTIHSNSCFPFN